MSSPGARRSHARGGGRFLLWGVALSALLWALPTPSAQAQGPTIIDRNLYAEGRLFVFGDVCLGSTSCVFTELPLDYFSDPLLSPIIPGITDPLPMPVGDVADFDFMSRCFTPTALGPRVAGRIAETDSVHNVLIPGVLEERIHVLRGEKFIGTGVPPCPIPEPGSLALLGSGLVPGMGMLLRRRRWPRRDAGAEPGPGPE